MIWETSRSFENRNNYICNITDNVRNTYRIFKMSFCKSLPILIRNLMIFIITWRKWIIINEKESYHCAMNNLLEIRANQDFLFQSCCIHILLVKMFVTTALRNLLQFGMAKKIFARYYVQENVLLLFSNAYCRIYLILQPKFIFWG